MRRAIFGVVLVVIVVTATIAVPSGWPADAVRRVVAACAGVVADVVDACEAILRRAAGFWRDLYSVPGP